MAHCVEVGTRQHHVAQFEVHQERKIKVFVGKSIVDTTNPLRQGRTKRDQVVGTQWNPVATIYDATLCITTETETINLSHFLTYHLAKFTIEYVGTYSDAFTWLIGQQTQYFGNVVRSVKAQIPTEIGSAYGYQIQQHFHPIVAAFPRVDQGVRKAGSVGNLSRYDLVIGDFLVHCCVQRNPVVEHFQLKPDFSLRSTHGAQPGVGEGESL